jgi:hypothetical protein
MIWFQSYRVIVSSKRINWFKLISKKKSRSEDRTQKASDSVISKLIHGASKEQTNTNEATIEYQY